jgi:hypothetical protein
VETLEGIFSYESRRMISGQAEAQIRTYEMYVGKSGRAWFVPYLQTDKADNIYVTDSADWLKRGNGFGGTTLRLNLKDGSDFALRGGWHSNAEGLLEDTGVDVTDTHLTYGAVGLSRVENAYMTIGDLIYKDEEPTMGKYNRIRTIAVEYANEHNVTVYYCVQSTGGGSCGPIKPGDEVHDW